jgi:hypothetical protein
MKWTALVGLVVATAAQAQLTDQGSSAARSVRPAAAQTAGVPVIVDARNNVVGPAYGQGVILSVQGIKVYVDLRHTTDNINFSPTDLSWGPMLALFPTPDCSGPPLILAGPTNGIDTTPFRPALVVRNGNKATLYIAGTSVASNQTVDAEEFPSGVCGIFLGPYPLPAYAVEITVDLTQLHPEPLHVR